MASHQAGVGIFVRVAPLWRAWRHAVAGCGPAGDVAVRSGHNLRDDPAP
jgi:hypothetical protein